MDRLTKPILLAALTLLSATSFAAQIEFSGNLVFVLDPLTGPLAGTPIGTTVSGTITYGDSSLDAQFTLPGSEEASYLFTRPEYGSSVSIAGQNFNASGQVRMDMVNNAAQSRTAETVFDGLFGESDEFDFGVPYDDWGVSSWPTDAVITPGGGGQGDGDYYLGGGVFIAVGVRSFDESLYADTDYVGLPPALDTPVYGQFRIVQRDVDGTLLFDATGNLTSLTGTHPVSTVPLPLSLLMFVPCLVGLARFSARRISGNN